MVIHFLKEDALTALKANISGHIKNYDLKSNEWIGEFFDGDKPFLEYKTQIGDFHFADVENNVENVIRLYTAMKDISDTQATDERLWAGLSHGDFWEFMHERWHNVAPNKDMQRAIRSRYFFNNGMRRSLFVNTLSRLWWIGRLTYDEKRKDPFELTRYLEEDFATKSLILFSSNYTSNKNILKGLLEALIELKQSGFIYGKEKRDLYYEASKYLNVLGGTHILDFFSAEEIKDRVIRHMWGLKGQEPPIINFNFNNEIAADLNNLEDTGEDSPVESKQINLPAETIQHVAEEKASYEFETKETPEYESGNENSSELTRNDIVTLLKNCDFKCIDNREISSIIWVIYDSEKENLLEFIAGKYGVTFKLERRGAISTDNQPAWCIYCK